MHLAFKIVGEEIFCGTLYFFTKKKGKKGNRNYTFPKWKKIEGPINA
jgi:hypothetical protein